MDIPRCFTCKHCCISAGYLAWSEVTPGDPGHWDCQQGVWDLGAGPSDKSDVLKIMKIGETCEHWEEDEGAAS